ncbi:hypothetical protein AALO_G00140270 [Alosa alosa]|uniref:Uncharacterized protein n=1 Tax=Alosa alosa TaxID=278164 RepID=A0AAV6GLC0_9TELE|nr:hypothetical protein AALO_G00140270 [Alosa alosa]
MADTLAEEDLQPSGSSYNIPAEWAIDHLEEQRSSVNKEGPISERANMETEAVEDVQPGEPAMEYNYIGSRTDLTSL